MSIDKIERTRVLNDELRHNFGLGTAVIMPGVASLGVEAVALIVRTVAVYDDFCHENDPHKEHDFGVFVAEGRTIFFKIDYYDKSISDALAGSN